MGVSNQVKYRHSTSIRDDTMIYNRTMCLPDGMRSEGRCTMPDPANLTDLMPDTNDINFYTADPDLAFLLEWHLSAEDNERAQSILTDMGAVASQKMDQLAELANRQGPTWV